MGPLSPASTPSSAVRHFYSYPFLLGLSPHATKDGRTLRHLFEHMLFVSDPLLAFFGVPQRVVRFPIAEAQSATLARWWSNRLALPTKEEMTMWEEQEIQKRDCDVSSFHDLRYPRDVAYIHRMHDLPSKAAPLQG